MRGSEHKNFKIAVVGGGLAGLTTAYRLTQMGYEVNLYEARNRLGGRIFTIKLQNENAELGGQNILDGGDAENILSLVDELQLKLRSNKRLIHMHYFDGSNIIDIKNLLKKYDYNADNLEEKLNKFCNSSKTIKEVLEKLFPDNQTLIKSFSAMLAAYEGLPPERLSVDVKETLYYMILGGLSLAHQGDGFDDSYIEFLWVDGGNNLLIEKLAEQIPHSNIHLNYILTSVSKKSSKYQLSFKNDEVVEADLIVFTIPSTVYQDINFEEGTIPKEILQNINLIEYGTNSKILVPVNGPKFANGSYTNGCMISYFPGEQHCACMYYVGEYGIFDNKTINETFERDLPLIKNAYNLVPHLKSPVLAENALPYTSYFGPVGYSWPNDPFSKGSYSCITAGQEEIFTACNMWNGEKVKILFAPINDRIFFAGEHTSILIEVDGTMEAAVESGERTARMIEKLNL